ncbi:hypothetical protein Pcinc_022414 [Petrolisthes cinctipes]|uniref:Uncharacterized protein n=1 Tax=Petrolisthes cinctipes TaxID=88211 RepID=A0AAE1FES5_PETCI|nr:hypothetical protein Pcinc_022414 [Petrolisthes cinctipes]
MGVGRWEGGGGECSDEGRSVGREGEGNAVLGVGRWEGGGGECSAGSVGIEMGMQCWVGREGEGNAVLGRWGGGGECSAGSVGREGGGGECSAGFRSVGGGEKFPITLVAFRLSLEWVLVLGKTLSYAILLRKRVALGSKAHTRYFF